MPHQSTASRGEGPLVSVILPAYGMGKFIRQALESIGSQTYGNWEVILVDDCGPEDGTREAMQEFRNNHPSRRVEYLRNKENTGCGESRNIGMDAARGEYFAFLDPDDFWGHGYLEAALKGIGNGDLCFPGVRLVDDQGADLGSRMGGRMEELRGSFPSSLFVENFLLPSCTVIHRRVREVIGGFDPNRDVMYAADWDFYLRCIAGGQRFVLMKEEHCYYRKHQGAATGNYLQMTRECAKVLKKNWKTSRGVMKARLKESLHVHLSRLAYLKISFRDWSGLGDAAEACLLYPWNPEPYQSLYKGLKNNWK